MRPIVLGLIIAAVSFASLEAPAQRPDSLKSVDPVFFALPLVFYTPETTLGFGAAGFFSWRFKSEGAHIRPSQLQLGGAYTLENQVLCYLPYQLWWDDERYALMGELGWYRYNYFFFGIGNDILPTFEELYGVDYPRLRLTFMRRFLPNFYAGIRFIADDFSITELDPDGLLIKGGIPGSSGGLNSGAGLLINFDSRDNIFDARKGWYAELNIDFHGKHTASHFDYTRIALDLRKYQALPFGMYVALRLYTEQIQGEAPFISMSLLGGSRRMRGFYEGRYRDSNGTSAQIEIRRHIYGKFGAVVFAATGAVSPDYRDLAFANIRSTYGAGLRFAADEEERINIRFDVGIGNGQPAYYFTVSEAF